jgi:FKBP-type peptidyl-prolyl cis-trans isomerase SlyD
MTKPVVEQGKMVFITFCVTDENNDLLERYGLPVGFVYGGASPLLERLERELEGKTIGDTVTVSVSPEQGFGPHREELTYTDDIENVPEEFRRIGAQVPMMNDQGETKTFVVTRIEGGRLTVDGNHPYAGKTVEFSMTVTDIREPTDEELESGRAADVPPMMMH